tara:strand:+ start:6336 stop:6746 length:411 start_codon:yes stop_codon:yes gene_type:complete
MGAPKLTDNDIEKAVMLLDGWSGKLTWKRYLAVLAVEIGHTYSKVAMLRQPRIKAAWDLAKDRVHENAPRGGYGNVAISLSAERVRELERRVERLTFENNQLLEQFVRWSHNATRRGLSLTDLDKPLPLAEKKATK